MRRQKSWVQYPSFQRFRIRWGLLLGLFLMTLGLATATTIEIQVFWLSLLVLTTIVLQWHDNPVIREALPGIVSNVLRLADDRPLTAFHHDAVTELLKVSDCPDIMFRTLASAQLQNVLSRLQVLGTATIEYDSTEAWRVAYEQLLRSPGLYQYRSVSHVETQHYWQDGPGRQSTLLNIELQQAGMVIIERIVIVAAHLWPTDSDVPTEPVWAWIDEQTQAGIKIRLVCESDLDDERELINDFGIYGNRAVGMQRLDAAGRTSRFLLSFDFDDVERAERCWEQLLLHTREYASRRPLRAVDGTE